ncbi:MAG: D-alanyl-D-alanine carboxypeptidase [Verrucomicrobia bacterium]|nr:D-alanyl-D-alanine carboxypeptidase [Verrucomicrobiota bacterium]
MRTLFRSALLLLACYASLTPAVRADYKGAIVMDAASGAVLSEENADVVSPPASVTKLMTFLVVHDALAAGKIQLTTPVPVAAEDAKTGGTQVWLDPRETFPVEDLLYALMIQSANDAASALARATAGSREAFVALMNARAASLGLTHTTFRSPHGLPPSNRVIAEGDLTSPRDLAKISRELLLHTDVLKYSSTKVRDFGRGVRPEPVVMRNHNHLLGAVAGCDGLKTGFTNAAGFCLAATAQRGDKRVIVVVMGSPDRRTRDAHVRRLIEEGFGKIPATSVFTGPPVAVAPVEATPAAPTGAPATDENAVRFVLPATKTKR